MSNRNININQSQASIGIGYNETLQARQISGITHNYAPRQNLLEAAAEIQKLLTYLEQTYSTELVAEEAIKQIEADPTLKQRVVSAVKEMGIEAFMQAINHPIAHILRAGIEGFKEAN
jgi:hypothetical protein